MGDIQIDELREKLQFSGLDMILSLSLQEQKEDNGKLRRARVNDYIDVFNLEMSIDNPDVGWSKRIGKFYENKRGYDNSSWRVGELNKVLGQDPVSYFMYDKPEFELCDEDKLTLVKSMVTKRDISRLNPIVKKKFPRITYDEAVKILKEKCSIEVEWGKDLRTIEEDKLSELYDTPVVVTRYPKQVKAFYMKEPEDSDPKKPVVNGVDFIAPEHYGEIIGGSERESDIKEIKKRLKEQGEDPDEYTFYLDTRKYGSVPHAGFGLGVERLVAWICGLDNIKDAIPFPRTMIRYKP